MSVKTELESLRDENDQLWAIVRENEQLRAENERLRAALAISPRRAPKDVVTTDLTMITTGRRMTTDAP